MEKICKFCNQIFNADSREVNRGNAHFCSLSCNTYYNNAHRKKYKVTCKMCNCIFESICSKAKTCSSKCKSKLYRLQMKSCDNNITRRLREFMISQPCEICKWNVTSCDVHHVVPVYQGGKDVLNNLITLCPNCHRMAHRNLLSQDNLFKVIYSRTISSPSSDEVKASGALAGN